jgi:uncharacterized protein (TIGR02145 family)
MKKLIILLAIFTTVASMAQSVGINADGSAANASAMLDVSSTTKGFLPPRMTEAERNILSTTAASGLLIWCTNCGTAGELQAYNGTAWTNLIGNTASAATFVTIGTQKWATKNLDVTTYRDGTVIPQVTSHTEWAGLTTGAWCYYINQADNGTTYGKLYNWYAVNDSRGLAPVGWHIPTHTEWTTLTSFLGGDSVAGGKLKATGTTHWTTPNTAATDSKGFRGLPGGGRYIINSSSAFITINDYGIWWSSTVSTVDNTKAISITLDYSSASVYYNIPNKATGNSVRCVKD